MVEERFRDGRIAREIVEEIRRLKTERKVKFMHVCGTALSPDA